LIFVPEIFGAAAIILGAYTWKYRQGSLGPIVLVLGIIFMIVGIEVTALIG
jgi:membrane-bound ClpP family serine protease